MIVRPAVLADLSAIDAMRKADGDALGFFPIVRYEWIVSGDRRAYFERLIIVEDNGEVTGFVFAALWSTGAKIEQICVRRDARMMERATALLVTVEREAVMRHSPKIKCRVAYDIEANFFWTASGYQPVGTVISHWLNWGESKAKRPLIHYEKALCQLEMFELLSLRPAA